MATATKSSKCNYETTPKATAVVALQAANGDYVVAESGGGRMMANRKTLGTWETFELIDLGSNRIAIRAYTGKYVCADSGGGGELHANRDKIGKWETFVVQQLPNNQITLQVHDGQYVVAEGSGGRELRADRVQASTWEKFTVVAK